MTTHAIKSGDILQVARDGRYWIGLVTGISRKPGGGKTFHVVPIDPTERDTHRHFRARQIIGHWQRRHAV